MAAGSQPLAFAELAFGGLLLTSAITGETIGELLTNGLTQKGKERLHTKATESETTESEPLSAPSGGGPELEPGSAAKPGTVAPPPGSIPVGKHPKISRLTELKHGLETALHFKEKLEHEVGEGRKSKRTAEKQFRKAFPWYAVWARELKELLK